MANDPLEAAFEHFRAGRFAEAELAVRARLAAEAGDPNAWRLYGMIAQQLGENDFAQQALTRAVALRPDVAEFHYTLGNVLRAAGRFDQAADAYRAALKIRPEYVDAIVNLGIALTNDGKIAEAEAAWMAALEREPNDVSVLSNLSLLHRDAGRLSRAIEYGERAVALGPNVATAHSNLGAAYQQRGQLDEAIASCRRALALPDVSVYTHSNLLLNLTYRGGGGGGGGIEPAEIFAEHRRFNARHAAPLAAAIRPHANDRSPDRRLRIGYVSGDLRDHAVAYFMEPILAPAATPAAAPAHSPQAMEVFCYMTAKADAVTRRLQSHGHTWRSLVGVSDAKAAEMIRGDGIDILVDLSVHTGLHRLLLFARRPAPVQATYLGYAGTTGLDAIDWRITDAIVDPPGGLSESLHSERLMRLPRSQWCYRPPANAPDAAATPPAVANGFVTFGAATNMAKITPQTVDLWANVLAAMPRSRLALKARSLADQQTASMLRARFAAHGIDAEARIDCQGAGDIDNYLRFFATIDVALDTFPFAGGTTTCHALFMGVPVVTLIGASSVSRVGASVLTNVGLPDLICDSPERFVQCAVELAADVDRLRDLRRTLRRTMLASPLCDAAAFVRDLEAAYRQMWREWLTRG